MKPVDLTKYLTESLNFKWSQAAKDMGINPDKVELLAYRIRDLRQTNNELSGELVAFLNAALQGELK